MKHHIHFVFGVNITTDISEVVILIALTTNLDCEDQSEDSFREIITALGPALNPKGVDALAIVQDEASFKTVDFEVVGIRYSYFKVINYVQP